tara:strand:+ start:370 stop:1044 length:675 start_codon:yes stop_codon:yes gene_type:complete
METKKNGLALKDELSLQIMKRRDITASTKLVLIGILSRVDWSTWKSSPSFKNVSYRDLADICGSSYSTVTKAIEKLEKLKLIERDVFKSTKRTAPPTKVNIKLIQEYKATKIKRYKGKAKTKPTFTIEEIKTTSQGDNKTTSVSDAKTTSVSDAKTTSLSIENNNTSIYSQYINPSLGQECIKDFAYNGEAEDWGTPNAELWGDHLHNDLLNVIPQNTDMKDKD